MHILVCVTRQKTCERLILEGARMAEEFGAELSVLHVAKSDSDFLGNPVESQAIEYLYQISAAHGADMTLMKADNVMEALVSYARRKKADMIVLGSSRKGDRNFAQELGTLLPETVIHVAHAPE